MGEYADDAFDRDFNMGLDNSYEDFEDMDGGIYPKSKSFTFKSKICKYCNTNGLHWSIINRKYRLFDKNNKIHICPKNQLVVRKSK